MSGAPVRESNPVTVLLIEDSADDIFLIQRLIVQSGLAIDLRVIRDGEEALEFLLRREDLPQVVLLDFSLPRMSGMEILRRIKSDELLEGIPVIVISGTELDDEIRFDLGPVHSHITKPISLVEFSWIMRSIESYTRRIALLGSTWGPAFATKTLQGAIDTE